MSYTYNPGDPVTVLLPSEPADSAIIGTTADESLRQIKAYLKDPTVGPEAKYQTLRAQFDALVASAGGASATPVGLVTAVSRTADFTGWLLCDGRAISRTTYSDLFGIIGVNFGAGDGTTTFNLPDFKTRIPVATDPTFNVTTAAINFASFGEITHTLTEGESGPHAHKYLIAGYKHIIRSTGGEQYGYKGGDVSAGPFSARLDKLTGQEALTSMGGGASHNNMMPTITINYFIKS